MKRVFLLILTGITILSCKNETTKNFVTLSGNITNQNSNELSIRNSENKLVKTINVNEGGVFNDTLHVIKGKYAMSDGNEYALLYIRPGDDINISLDADKFDETLTFSGKGSKESNYIVSKLLMQEKAFDNINDMFSLPKEAFLEVLENKKLDFQKFLKEQKELDESLKQSKKNRKEHTKNED